MVYLDYAANTPVDKRILDDFYNKSLKYYANPNSIHKLGIECKNIIDDVSDYIANVFNVQSENIIYTSGASESNNLIIKGFAEKYKDGHIIITTIEHSSITAPASYLLSKGYNVDIIDVNEDGLIDVSKLESLITEKQTLVSVTSVESETGIIENIEEIGDALKKYPNVYFHTDATGAIGKLDINFENIDIITFAPHKFYGINGIGVLIKKDNVKLLPLIHGGKSTTIYRSGTPVTSLISSVKVALELAISSMKENNEYLKTLNKYIKENLSKYDNIIINSKNNCIPNTINISIKGISSSIISNMLDEKEIYLSTKSACSSKENMSKVIYTLTKNEELSKSTLRISISHLTKKEEIDEFLMVFDEIMKKVG